MQISDERIEEFRRLYKEEYGEEISLAEAKVMAERLLNLYVKLAQPLPSEGQDPQSAQN